MSRVLVVDDEPQIRRALETSLGAHGHEVRSAPNGKDAIVAAAEEPPDLVFLDLGLPDLEGTDVIRRIRAFSDVPIIVISVRDRQADKVDALDAGADDYVTKPFGVEEVLARLRAAVRRSHAGDPAPAALLFGDLKIDLGRRLVTLHGQLLHLTKTEYALLEALVTNPGKLLTHRWLLQRVWGTGYGEESHYLRVYVRAMRRKLGDDASAPRLILTEPGVGYRWIAARSDGSSR